MLALLSFSFGSVLGLHSAQLIRMFIFHVFNLGSMLCLHVFDLAVIALLQGAYILLILLLEILQQDLVFRFK